jgi:hypothetical protein
MAGDGEAVVDRLVYERFFAGASDGVFVEVGAAGPEFLSMSAFYRELGWRVRCALHLAASADAVRRQSDTLTATARGR